MPDDTVVVDPPARSVSAGRRLTWEHALPVGLGLLVLAVHDVGYVLAQPFWTDEAWVAVTTRFPLGQLPVITSSTPIGWSVLLRIVTLTGHQTSRLLPLAFAGVAVLIAYWLARRLDWPRRDMAVLAGVLAAVAVLLVPAMLVRDDLKQYTADAAVALLVVACVSRLERDWSRWSLAGLSCVVWAGMLVSHTTAFVGVSAFAGVCVVELLRRDWRRLVEAVVAAVGTGVLMAGVYLVFDARAVVSGLTSYWSAYYLPVGGGQWGFLVDRWAEVRSYFGLGPAWVVVVLFLGGVVTIYRLGRPAAAVTVVIIWPVMLAVSAVRRYPFLDLRTSTFLIVLTVVVAGVGVAGCCALVRRRFRGVLSYGLAAVALAGFATQVSFGFRSHSVPTEDVRDQATYVAAHAAPDDVVVVNMNSNWSFAYYWPVGTPARRDDSAVLQGYEAYFPDQPRIVVAADRDDRGVASALDEALARAGHRGVRLWLVRAHVVPSEQRAWSAAISSHGLNAVPVGDKGLSVITLAR